jgi:hypothetical protein
MTTSLQKNTKITGLQGEHMPKEPAEVQPFLELVALDVPFIRG